MSGLEDGDSRIMPEPASWSIAQAKPEEAAHAVAILREVSQWLFDIGRPLWPVESFDLETFRRAAVFRELVLGYQQSTPVAAMLLQVRDDFYWPEDAAGDALYVHKVAVRRSAAGRNWSYRLLDWAKAQARKSGARYLRLDTERALVPLYERYGFSVVDDEPRITGDLWIYRLELSVEELL